VQNKKRNIIKFTGKIGIHLRIILAAFLLISAASFSLGYIGVGLIHKFVLLRFEERMAFLAKYLALNAELGILIDERTMLNRLAGNLLSEKDVTRVVIFNTADERLADVSKSASSERIHLSVVESPVLLKESDEESLAFQSDSVNQRTDEKQIGKVQITYSTEGISRLLSVIKSRFVWLSFAIAGICVIIFFFISRSIVAPITDLANAAREVAKGDLKLRVMLSNLPETREMTTAFNAMLDSLEDNRKALEEANRQMLRQKTLAEIGKFSMMIAHEVKNPLGIIKTSLDILKKDIQHCENPSSSNTEIMISYMEDEIRRLNRLIEDFLLFAKPAVPVFRETDMNKVLKESLENHCMRIGQMSNSSDDLQIDIPAKPCYISADPDLLIRAIDNIIKNAFEANEQKRFDAGVQDSSAKSVVRVRAFSQNNKWIAEIEDQGPGIASEHIQKIFEPFFTTRSKGTGLGLAFASQVIAANGGVVFAQNKEEGGALFRVEIPAGIKL